MTRRVVCVTQVEHIKRRYWVSVPESMDNDDIDQLFFGEDIGGGEHTNERYEVALDLNEAVGEFAPPDDAPIYELGDA